jgi:DNA-binding NarL/FixJ family response regulator
MQNGTRRPVLIADTNRRARHALANVLGMAGLVVLQADSGEDVLTAARRHSPCLYLLEVPLGRLSGYEVCMELRERLTPDVPVMFVSGVRTEPYDRVAGLLVGADDYVVVPYAADELLARVRRLIARSAPAQALAFAGLTPRELEVLQLLAEGYSVAKIAARLVISARTVATHVEHILAKLGVNSRAQAIALAYRDGLVLPRRSV